MIGALPDMARDIAARQESRIARDRRVLWVTGRLAVWTAKNSRRAAAFTLIELILTVILLSILLYFLSQMSNLLVDDIADRQTSHNQRILLDAINAYYQENGVWPPDSDNTSRGDPDKSGQVLINALCGYCPDPRSSVNWKSTRSQENLSFLSVDAWSGNHEPVRDGYGNAMRYKLKGSQPEWSNAGLYNTASIVTYQGKQYICISPPLLSERDAPPPDLPARWRLNSTTRSTPIIISPGKDGKFGTLQDTAAEQDDIRSDNM